MIASLGAFVGKSDPGQATWAEKNADGGSQATS